MRQKMFVGGPSLVDCRLMLIYIALFLKFRCIFHMCDIKPNPDTFYPWDPLDEVPYTGISISDAIPLSIAQSHFYIFSHPSYPRSIRQCRHTRHT